MPKVNSRFTQHRMEIDFSPFFEGSFAALVYGGRLFGRSTIDNSLLIV